MQPPTINICQIVIDEHGPIFNEVIELVTDGLEAIGVNVKRAVNRIDGGNINLLVGSTVLLKQAAIEAICQKSARCVVFQMEVLDNADGFAAACPSYLGLLRQVLQVWEYSRVNLPFLAAQGCRAVQHIPLGYARSLERITQGPEKDIDVLFYGAMNERRFRVLDELQTRGFHVEAPFGLYGAARDELIARSKIVLNLHQFETAQLEQVRISYLLNNRCFVVSELADENPFGDGLVFCDYKRIVECCISFLDPAADQIRMRIAEKGCANLKAVPFVSSLRSALAQLPI